jgi:Ulp1 protease family, C-terminal catalytic domain/Intraflagellar transport complex B protein 46 C terminal
MDPQLVEALRLAYNKEHPHEKPIKEGSHVWFEITRRLKDACDSGTPECIVHSLVQRPSAPAEWSANSEEWLSSDDIDNCQKYYEKLIPDYYYAGSVPIDFDLHTETGKCIVSSLCSMSLSKLFKKGYRRVGIVFNTDPHDKGGEHWIASFVDMREELEYPKMVFFDSYGREPEPEIQRLMKRWKEQIDEMKVFKKPMKLEYNKIRHQYKNAQCGMYCIYFLHCCLFDIPMDKQVPDDVIMMMRPMFFQYNK